MEPISVLLSAALSFVKWDKVAESLATAGATKGAKALLAYLQPTEPEQYAKQTSELFLKEFLTELEDKSPLTLALPGYRDQLKTFIEFVAPDLAAFLRPDTIKVDLRSLEDKWRWLELDALPEDFDWELVAGTFSLKLCAYMRRDPNLQAQLRIALQQELIELTKIEISILSAIKLAPGFDLEKYRAYLRQKCAALQLSVMHTSAYDRRITLWSVFVPQSARQSTPVRDIPRQMLRQLREEKQLTTDRHDEEVERLRSRYRESPVLPVLEVLARERLVVVLGDPGSGKTSLLKYLVLRWLETAANEALPVWIDLKEYVREHNGILRYCESGCTAFGLDALTLNQTLSRGAAAVYLDGLDEIFDGPTRGSVVEEVAAFAARYPQLRIVVTSRIIGYEPDRLRNAGFTHATLEDFDDSQVAEFLAKWHCAAEDDPKERSRLLTQMQSALRDSRAVRELAANPLLLTMTAILNRTQPLPRNRVELYQQASRVLLQEWDTSRSLPADTFARQEKEELLRELAGTMQKTEGGLVGNLIDRRSLIELFRTVLGHQGVPDPHHAATLLADRLVERNFILCFAGADRYSFVHRTFLEYFCAAWFVELFEKKQTLTLDALKQDVFEKHWKDERWHEVLRLIAGMLGEKQSAEIIQFLASLDGRADNVANLILAAECLGEVRNRQAIRQTSDKLRYTLIEAAVRFDPPWYYEPHEEFDLVGATREKAVVLLAAVWPDNTTHHWLRTTMRAEHQDWIARRAAVVELARGWKADAETLASLKECARTDKDGAVRQAAVQELARGWKDDAETLPWLKECARSDENRAVREAAVQELARGWKDDAETLPLLKARARTDKNGAVRQAAVQELARGWKDDAETLPLLKARARSDENWAVRQAAVQELARGWKDDAETLPLLKERVRSDENWAVRKAAVQELARGWKDDAETLPLLQERARTDERGAVRQVAVQELARGWKDDAETLRWLKERARSDENWAVRQAAVQELGRGWKDDAETLPWLKERARTGENGAVRQAAVQELARSWKKDAETLPLLKERARTDENEWVRQAAVQELARGWRDDAETLPWLKERARTDENGAVREAAVHELARGWKDDAETLPWLKERARTDDDNDVRQAAVQELARGWKDDPDIAAIMVHSQRTEPPLHGNPL